MAMERVPYLVGGGFEHSAEVMRAMLAAATSGAEGIVNAGDMKVAPLSVPGTSVTVGPGNALIRNSYGGGTAQTYAVRAASQTQLPIQATGSAGSRTDLIVARIDDPTYQGGAFDPTTFEAARFEVIRGVPAGTTTAAELGLSYPAIALARVTLPVSTGTITASMITDLRKIALPQKERHLFVHALVQGDGRHILNSDGQSRWWPLLAMWRVDVPEWAQRMRMVGQWGGVMLPKGSSGNAWGRIWVRLGEWADQSEGASSQETSWDLEGGRDTNVREAWMAGADRTVPANLRGRTGMQVGLMARTIGGDAADAQMPYLDSLSVASLDIEFYETAV